MLIGCLSVYEIDVFIDGFMFVLLVGVGRGFDDQMRYSGLDIRCWD